MLEEDDSESEAEDNDSRPVKRQQVAAGHSRSQQAAVWEFSAEIESAVVENELRSHGFNTRSKKSRDKKHKK